MGFGFGGGSCGKSNGSEILIILFVVLFLIPLLTDSGKKKI